MQQSSKNKTPGVMVQNNHGVNSLKGKKQEKRVGRMTDQLNCLTFLIIHFRFTLLSQHKLRP